MSEHRSAWLATAEHPHFPPLDGDLDVDVAVVGGGITGLTAALLLRRDGHRVALVEADRIGAGTTGGTTGKVTVQHGMVYASLIERHGVERAQAYAAANRAAVEEVAALVAELGIDCDLRRAPAYAYVRDEQMRGDLEAEHDAATRAGCTYTATTDIDLPFEVVLALRADEQILLHPSRYTAGLARALADEGVHVVEGTRATGVDERDDHAVVHTTSGRVRAAQVVVATLIPFLDRGGFFARMRPTRAYGISLRLGSDAPQGMHIDVGPGGMSTRPWNDGGRPGLVVVGSSHPTGAADVGPDRWDDLERWARAHVDVEAVVHRWSAQDHTTVDGIPYVGRVPMSTRTFVATGFRKWGLSNGTAAARLLADLLGGREGPWHAAFDATRIGGAATLGDTVKGNLEVAGHFVGDRLSRGRTGPTCTHLGCALRWNGAEGSWDCPCHGSRFAADGQVLDGPAVRALRLDPDASPGQHQP
ncbi:FAD-dependent oxidoreductase [Actinomarinicola tropica]|uniref:FAD-dependent oxidoreductase n=1 Tax=Actinomarinicola tropica TaxID=2789776 RepID=A0A5Q2RBP0_9ACTN|nr:FAD-dependent oxidoreductase [Actinomarinicola tropica]QGG94248.1 FAD-dependent oxidoreductase [Actinomarinicola tropica]